MGLGKRETKKYLSIIADGSIRLSASDGADGAVKRAYETSDGKKGEKWEYVYDDVMGFISNIEFVDGDYGKVLNLTITDEEDFTLSLNTSSSFAEDIMKKLPNVKLDREVKLIPYSFTDDNGKPRKGVTILQATNKVTGYFYDAEKKKSQNGYPEPEGDRDTFDSDDWKAFYIKARKFLVGYTIYNIVPKVLSKEEIEEAKRNQVQVKAPIIDTNPIEYPVEEINPEDIPF